MTRCVFREGRARTEDAGVALVTVLVTLTVITLFITAAVTFAVQATPQARRTQDWQAALAAAQVGVDDYLARLNDCDTYWDTRCPSSPPTEPALNNWVRVPGSTGATPAEYRYSIVSSPSRTKPGAVWTPGLIRLRGSGRVNSVTRTIVVELRKPSFLNYLYYTDKESVHPDIVTRRFHAATYYLGGKQPPDAPKPVTEERRPGIPQAQAQERCGRYWYETSGVNSGRRPYLTQQVTFLYTDGTTGTRNRSESCEIWFTDGDLVDGPLYTKDAINIAGSVRFNGKTETYWQATSQPPANPSAPYNSYNGAAPSDSGQRPTIAARSVDMPPNNAALRDQTDPSKPGCRYVGPTRIVLLDTGRMSVTSPNTTSANPGCGTFPNPGAQTVDLPVNGVVYVDPLTGTRPCGTRELFGRYPVPGDVTEYNCLAGDVFVEGTLRGQLTIGADGDITATNDLRYDGGTTGSDILGLAANGFVQVYHPVACKLRPEPSPLTGGPYACVSWENIPGGDGVLGDIVIQAAILSASRSFTVQNYDKGARLGKVRVVGGIYQRHRGPVGSGAGNCEQDPSWCRREPTGYLKDYVYDQRLRDSPPPYFIEPVQAAWFVDTLTEG